METLTDSNSEAKAGKKFRLTVKSAEEAVRVIREKLGEKARVLSVRQVGGEGLKKFISSPKLEVIAEIPSNEESNENGDIKIQITGLRPGEKLFEELLIDDKSSKTIHPLIYKGHEKSLDTNFLWENLKSLEELGLKRQDEDVKKLLWQMMQEDQISA